jgi:eukaryotic-like serine/threonine-protein kinase
MKGLLSCFFMLSSLFASAQSSHNRIVSTVHFNIICPEGWTIDTSRSLGAEVFLFSPNENSNDKFRENINVLIQNTAGYGINLDEYVSITEKQIQSEIVKDGNLLSSERIKMNNSEYHKLIYTATQGKFQLKILQHLYMVKGNAYVLTYTAEADKFEQYINSISETMNSFTINQ